jgi:hypothetical protein
MLRNTFTPNTVLTGEFSGGCAIRAILPNALYRIGKGAKNKPLFSNINLQQLFGSRELPQQFKFLLDVRMEALIVSESGKMEGCL